MAGILTEGDRRLPFSIYVCTLENGKKIFVSRLPDSQWFVDHPVVKIVQLIDQTGVPPHPMHFQADSARGSQTALKTRGT